MANSDPSAVAKNFAVLQEFLHCPKTAFSELSILGTDSKNFAQTSFRQKISFLSLVFRKQFDLKLILLHQIV